METIDATPLALDLKEFVKRSALETDYSRLVKRDTLVRVEGIPRILYLNLDWDFEPLLDILQRIRYQESERTGGLKTVSRVFGFQPRVALRRDYCTATSLAHEDTPANNVVCSYGNRIETFYAQLFPEVHADHARQARDKILPEWRIAGTSFSSGIINKNNPLKYHFDSGNFENVCSCMLGFKRDIGGGYLSCPELDLGFQIADQSLLIFDGQSILHGVTPIVRATPRAYRYTIVYYTLKGMWQCEPLSGELARIRNLKTRRERKRAGLDDVVVDQHGERKE